MQRGTDLEMKMIVTQQGSEAWKEWRKGKICASDLPIIMGKSKYSTPLELWKRKLGFTGEQEVNYAMQRGTDLEPVIRDMVNIEKDYNFDPACVENDNYEWAACSLDGIDREKEMICEIKCTNKKNHELAKSGKIPDEFKPFTQ